MRILKCFISLLIGAGIAFGRCPMPGGPQQPSFNGCDGVFDDIRKEWSCLDSGKGAGNKSSDCNIALCPDFCRAKASPWGGPMECTAKAKTCGDNGKKCKCNQGHDMPSNW